MTLLHAIEKVVPPEGWLRTATITAGVGFGLLFCIRTYLRSRRARCLNKVLLTGKTCIVTGANTGIGKAVVRELARREARVIMACRDVQKGGCAAAEIRKELCGAADLLVLPLNLASFASIRNFAAKVLESESRIDILVNNAGIYQCPFMLSEDGIEMQFSVNHLGHFLLTNLLLKIIEQPGDSRIVVVSSGLYKYATMDMVNFNSEELYRPELGYNRSKLANILFANELANRVKPGVTVCSVCPGMARTDLGRYRLTNVVTRILFNFASYFFVRSADEAAQTIIFAVTAPELKGTRGKHLRDCRVEPLLAHAMDERVALKLWELSERLTGLTDDSESENC